MSESNEDRERRIRLWIAGYRQLMQGGLSEQVHLAGTRSSKLNDENYAYITIGDIEWLLDGDVQW